MVLCIKIILLSDSAVTSCREISTVLRIMWSKSFYSRPQCYQIWCTAYHSMVYKIELVYSISKTCLFVNNNNNLWPYWLDSIDKPRQNEKIRWVCKKLPDYWRMKNNYQKCSPCTRWLQNIIRFFAALYSRPFKINK